MRAWLVLVSLTLLFACGEEGGLKGTLKIAITDAPIDAANVKSVNVVITNVEGYQNGNWKSFRYFEQPTGVNLLAYTGGKSVLLIDQYTNPGEFSSLRLSLNIANRNSSLIVNPQSNVVFKNGTSAPLYMRDGAAPEIVLEKYLGIHSRGLTDVTLDFDLRKSIRINDIGEYVLEPFVRIVDTNKSGHLEIDVTSSDIPNRLVAFAYNSGVFTTTESMETLDRIAFHNSLTSASLASKKAVLGFLEAGQYDVVFVKYDEVGKVLEVMGKKTGLQISAGENTSVELDLTQLSPP